MGFHFQTPVNDWPLAVAKLPAGAMVKSFQTEMLSEAKAHNPGVFTAMRYHHDHLQWYSNDWNQMVAKWRDIFPRFVDGTFRLHAANVDAIEEHNEYFDNSMGATEYAPRINSARAALWVWRNDYQSQPDYRHIKLIIGNAPVGNDTPIEYARLAIEYDAILGYHPYTLWEDKVRADYDWPYVSGRFDLLEDVWRQDGLDTSKLYWAFTEAGPFRGAWDGWRASSCLGADFELYLQALRLWIADMAREAEAYRQGRIKGFALFTCNSQDGNWEHYRLFYPELDRIAGLMREIWRPGTVPVPPPPPPDDPPEVDYVVIANLLPQNATRAEVDYVLDQTWEQRQTILFSADDAARLVAPGQPGSRVMVWEPDRWSGIVPWLQERGVAQVEWRQFLPPVTEPGGFRFTAWPTDSRIVTQPFGANPDYYAKWGLPGHEGIDLKAATGAPIYAVADGVASLRGNDPASYGLYLVIDHGEWLTYYAHLQGFEVPTGAPVKAGQIVGRADNTGASSGSHLHLSLKHKTDLYTDANGVEWPRRFHDPTKFLEAI